MKDFIKKNKAIFENARKIRGGFQILKQTNKTPEFAYQSMRRLFVDTKGKSNDVISLLIKKKKYINVNKKGVLGIDNVAVFSNAINNIRKDGFHIFDTKLPEEIIKRIVDYAKVTPTVYRKIDGKDNKVFNITFSDEVIFDEQNPISPLYQFTRQKIVDNKDIQDLIFDSSLLAFAQEYLNTKPIVDLVAMWWSVPFEGKGKSEAAQMYHFDLDRIKFIKFFFYLTDVDAETGPHCYVRSSHKRLLPALQKDGRLTDEEVEAAYGKENLLELCGKKGTIMAVDTRGLHKGKDLTKDKRLIFQIEFANSMFGQYYVPGKKPVLKEDLEKIYNEYNYTYKEIMN